MPGLAAPARLRHRLHRQVAPRAGTGRPKTASLPPARTAWATWTSPSPSPTARPRAASITTSAWTCPTTRRTASSRTTAPSECPSVPAPLQKGAINRPGPMLPGWNLTNILPELTRRAVRYVEDAAQRPASRSSSISRSPRRITRSSPRDGVQGPQPGRRLRRFRRAGGWHRGRGARRARPHRPGDQHARHLHQRQRARSVSRLTPALTTASAHYGHRSMDGLRGVKRDTWEGGHRVPFLARWPGHIPAGRHERRNHLPRGPAGDLRRAARARSSRPTPARTVTTSCPALLGKKPEPAHSRSHRAARRQRQVRHPPRRLGAD